MFQRIVFTAALAGLISGLFLFSVQSLRVIPLIQEAETYEAASATPPQPRSLPPEPSGGGISRKALTALSNVITAIGFGFLLTAGLSLNGGSGLKQGLLWGLGGFAVFSLSPGLGLPPELPGTIAAGLFERQRWWLGAVTSTAAGLVLLAFVRGAIWKALGVLLIIFPHLIGAPRPALHDGLAPEALQRQFAVAALATSGIFWLVLGGLSGYLFERFGRT